MEETQKEPEKTENKTEDNANTTVEDPKGEGKSHPTMKKNIEIVLNKVVKSKKAFKLIRKRPPNKIDIEQKLNAMRMDSLRHKKEKEDYSNIKDRESTVAERISQYEAEMQKLEEIRGSI